jgi:hypothetical protein
VISDILKSINIIANRLEANYYSPEEGKKMIDKANKLGMALMITYPREYFLPEESDFLSDFMNKLNWYTTEYGGYDGFQ